MKSAIEGPNCVNLCKGDCCSIKIDIPKVLAEEYIRKGYAEKTDFTRSDVFSFKLRFNETTGKCFLFDKLVNGCLVHHSSIKPPQCFIYPTNFSLPDQEEVSCKRLSGWKIIDPVKTQEAEELLKYYIFLCKLEARREIRNLKGRLSNSLKSGTLNNLLQNTAPSSIAGVKDTWDSISLLSSEGFSLQLKKLCAEYNQECGLNFIKCDAICPEVSQGILEYLQGKLYRYVKIRDPDGDGEYPFFKLFK
ncbi:MAG: hypothetical protein ACW986_14985 [Promethearchaeota archaeon]|jgi:Fe-S-cluster containining protein